MKCSPVELVQVQSTGEVRRQYKGVANALQGGVHETRVTEVVQTRGSSFYWHYTTLYRRLHLITHRTNGLLD